MPVKYQEGLQARPLKSVFDAQVALSFASFAVPHIRDLQNRLDRKSRRMDISGLTPAWPDGRALGLCVDGRAVINPTNNEIIQRPIAEESIHFPGLALGACVAVQRFTQLTAQETVTIVKETTDPFEPLIHTDTHNLDGVGCLAAKGLMGMLGEEVTQKMGSRPTVAKEMYDIIFSGAGITSVYGNDHAEIEGYIINSENVTIRSPHGKGQSFVYDRKRTENWVRNFVPKLNVKLRARNIAEINTDEFWLYLDSQAIAAMELLTIQSGKDLHTINESPTGRLSKVTRRGKI